MSVLEDVRAFMQVGQPDAVASELTVPAPSPGAGVVLQSTGRMLAALAADFALSLPNATPMDRLCALRARLMLEELGEVLSAMAAGDVVEVADGLADLQYVVAGTAVSFGIPLDAVHTEVHRSNMEKFLPCGACEGNGYPVKDRFEDGSAFTFSADPCVACAGLGRVVLRDGSGKIQKPAGWTPPDVQGVLARHVELLGRKS